MRQLTLRPPSPTCRQAQVARREERVRHSDQGRVERELCHDLMNPASTIRLLAEALLGDGLGPSARSRVEQMAGEATRILTICNSELGRRAGPEAVRLDVAVAGVVESLRFSYQGHLGLATEPVCVAVPEGVILRVLANLADNACRAAGPAGSVRITAGCEGGWAWTEVADSGPGLGQGPPGRASLGLGIVESLVKRHGGRLEAGRSELGGARVLVTLPAAPTPGAARMVEALGHGQRGGPCPAPR